MKYFSNIPKNKLGFGLIDSLIGLAILGALIAGVTYFNHINERTKMAKELAGQTEAFAKAFTSYMNNNASQLLAAAANSPVVITSQTIQDANSWPTDLATTNMYHQTPCVTVSKNSITNKLEAIMYYVGGVSNTSTDQIRLVKDAVILLGNKGGVTLNGDINGNSGWSITANSSFLDKASQCGGTLTNNSLAINLDLMEEWNQDLQPNLAITKVPDNTLGLMSLPGHMLNTNTPKSNIYFANNAGIILDNSNPNNPIKLSIQDNGSSTGSPTLGFGTTSITTLNANTIQPNRQGRAGDPCQPIEIGKIIADEGSSIPQALQVLARNTLVCTQNEMLCASYSVSNTCYLPSITNSLVYQNNTQGIQDNSGQFNCPAAVPFATNVVTSAQTGGMGEAYNEVYCNSNQSVCNNTNYQQNTPVENITGLYLGSSKIAPVSIVTQGSISATPIVGSLSGYTVNIGYKLTGLGATIDCTSTCQNAAEVLFNGYNQVSAASLNTDIYTHKSFCACKVTNTSFIGVDVSNANLNGIITSVTCSNMPTYISVVKVIKSL